MGHAQMTKTEITKTDHQLSETSYFIEMSHVLTEL